MLQTLLFYWLSVVLAQTSVDDQPSGSQKRSPVSLWSSIPHC